MLRRFFIQFTSPLIVLGILVCINFLVILRESFTLSFGNEIFIGITLGLLFLLTIPGILTAKLNFSFLQKTNFTAVSFILFSIISAISFFTIRLLPVLSGNETGTTLSIYVLLTITLSTLPISFCSGYLIASFIRISKRKPENLNFSFFQFILGGIAGAIIFSFFMNRFFHHSTIQFFSFLASMLYAVYTVFPLKRKIIIFAFITVIPIISSAFLFYPADFFTQKLNYPNQNLIAFRETSQGNFAITDSVGKLKFYENKNLISIQPGIRYAEESIHFPMLQNAESKKVMFFSASFSGYLEEILKYKPERIVLLPFSSFHTGAEICSSESFKNFSSIEKTKKLYSFFSSNSRVDIVTESPDQFTQNNKKQFDVIIQNLPDPGNSSLNRYFTLEFFKTIKQNLNQKGVFSLSLNSDYAVNNQHFIASVWKALKQNFSNTIVILGERNFFIASDAPLSYQIAKHSDERGLENIYLNRLYINDSAVANKSGTFEKSLDTNALPNSVLFPFSKNSIVDISFAKENQIFLLICIIICLLLFPALFVRTKCLSLFATGFSTASYFFVILSIFQSLFGFLYYNIGIFLMLFMIGIACGSFIENKYRKKTSFDKFLFPGLTISLALLLSFVPEILMYGKTDFITGNITLGILTLSCGLILGAFLFTSKSSHQKPSAIIVLIGFSIGLLLTSVLLIPIWGFANSALLSAIPSLSALVIIMIKKNVC